MNTVRKTKILMLNVQLGTSLKIASFRIQKQLRFTTIHTNTRLIESLCFWLPGFFCKELFTLYGSELDSEISHSFWRKCTVVVCANWYRSILYPASLWRKYLHFWLVPKYFHNGCVEIFVFQVQPEFCVQSKALKIRVPCAVFIVFVLIS